MHLFHEMFETPFGDSDAATLYQALFFSEERAFEVLDSLQRPLDPAAMGRCLSKAMRDCSLELFRRLLKHAGEGECASHATIFFQLPGGHMEGYGSLLTLAAMLDRPLHAQLLLDQGYDCNGAGLSAAAVLQGGNGWGQFVPSCARNCGAAGSWIQVERNRTDPVMILCVTPLAAALLCGSQKTAEILLRWPGVWTESSSAVCRAAVMVLEGITDCVLPEEQRQGQREILRQIFYPDAETLPKREILLRQTYLQPACFADFCRGGTLRAQLESGLCGEDDARQVIRLLEPDEWWCEKAYDRSRAGKLLALKHFFPEACREDSAKEVFLREILCRVRKQMPYQTLLNAWKQLCGPERDLTWASELLWLLHWRELKTFLTEAEKGGILVMDADAVRRWNQVAYRCMCELLRHIHFYGRDGEGASGLMQYLMLLGDMRVLRQAVKQGVLGEEDPKVLMQCLIEEGCTNQDMRIMMLTYAGRQVELNPKKADWQNPRRWSHWCSWDEPGEEAAIHLLQSLLYSELPRVELLRIMFRLSQYLNQDVFAPDMTLENPEYPTLQTDSLVGFACCAERGQSLEVLMEDLPEKLLKPVRVSWGDKLFFQGTPLALAAAMGRQEQVKMLLDAGVHPDEEGRGDISQIFTRKRNSGEGGVPVTPLLAAILFGRRETAELLLAAGAKCDFGRREHRQILWQGNAETLKLAADLPGVGFERIPVDELESIQEITAPWGERTYFWQDLKR